MQIEDKLGVRESGLNISEAFVCMEDRAADMYHRLIIEIWTASNGIVSIRTAMNAASQVISSLYSPIFGRIDPEEVGSRSRAMRIGEEYADRLNSKSRNLKEQFIQELTSSYPSHGFVIDFNEAQRMFTNVRQANKSEIETIKKLGKVARIPQRKPEFRFLKQDEVCKNDDDTSSEK